MVRVDMIRKSVIIAVGGKIGKPLLASVDSTTHGTGGDSRSPPITFDLSPRHGNCGAPEWARGIIRDDFGPPTSYGETLPGPHSCDWPRASKGWTYA